MTITMTAEMVTILDSNKLHGLTVAQRFGALLFRVGWLPDLLLWLFIVYFCVFAGCVCTWQRPVAVTACLRF